MKIADPAHVLQPRVIDSAVEALKTGEPVSFPQFEPSQLLPVADFLRGPYATGIVAQALNASPTTPILHLSPLAHGEVTRATGLSAQQLGGAAAAGAVTGLGLSLLLEGIKHIAPTSAAALQITLGCVLTGAATWGGMAGGVLGGVTVGPDGFTFLPPGYKA